MRRVTALCAAAGVAASALTVAAPAVAAPAVAAPAQAKYYLIRWNDTGICQIWNEELNYKPPEWLSHYKVMNKPVPTFSEAMAAQIKMRGEHRCTL